MVWRTIGQAVWWVAGCGVGTWLWEELTARRAERLAAFNDRSNVLSPIANYDSPESRELRLISGLRQENF